jgi:hypothetical protein
MAGDEWNDELKAAVFQGQDRLFRDVFGEHVGAPRRLLLRSMYVRCTGIAPPPSELGEE